MVERTPQTKNDEQYPLLKVDAGGGDEGRCPQSAPTVLTSGWNVTCTPKQSWLDRWPEFVSACWMTLILLGISFLVFYALSMGVHKRQPVIIMKCNNSKPVNEVYYHHIIQRGSYTPYNIYSDYLSKMALQYPFLHFKVFFLIDDSLQNIIHGSKHNKLINRLMPRHLIDESYVKLDESNKRMWKEFEMKYLNVNVTVTTISKYMATTPLRNKWRTIPITYLPFYARIFAVWQNGGIGLDLDLFNNHFIYHQRIDRRITSILKQHNEGIKTEEYRNIFRNNDRDEMNELFILFYSLTHQIFNETRTLFNKNLPFSNVIPNKDKTVYVPLIKTHRSKRQISNETKEDVKNISNNNLLIIEHVELLNTTLFPVTNESSKQIVEHNSINHVNVTSENIKIMNTETISPLPSNNNKQLVNSEMNLNKSEESFDIPQLDLFYDFSVISDGFVPSYIMPEPLMPSNLGYPVKSYQHGKGTPHFLAINPEGSFVAATSLQHPFLSYLILTGCQGMEPKFIIENTYMAQCSGIRYNNYCDNIYFL